MCFLYAVSAPTFIVTFLSLAISKIPCYNLRRRAAMLSLILFLVLAFLFAVTWRGAKNLPDEPENDDFIVPLDLL